ncbi:hypothetical protein CASFOL_018982 [Castilleja foliolosa]|uniref:Uncharacterized protein n=1 Tax=Castilleja foliolosa TaxID=1961234 RepID=A0ABD3D346_9LAMI
MYMWIKGGPKKEAHLIHSIWANFQTSANNDCMSLLSSEAWHLDKAHGFNFFPWNTEVNAPSCFRLTYPVEGRHSICCGLSNPALSKFPPLEAPVRRSKQQIDESGYESR